MKSKPVTQFIPRILTALMSVAILMPSVAMAGSIHVETDKYYALDAKGQPWVWGTFADSDIGLDTERTDINQLARKIVLAATSTQSKVVLDVSPIPLTTPHRFASFNNWISSALKPDGTLWEGLRHSTNCKWNPTTTSLQCQDQGSITQNGIYNNNRKEPYPVNHRWKEVHMNQQRLGVAQDGSLWWWGNKATVDGKRTFFPPTQAPLKGAHHSPIVLGSHYTGTFAVACAIRDSDGSIWCWGPSKQFRGTDEQAADDTTPTRVKVEGKFTKLIAKKWTACALRDDQSIWCWGDNKNGQLGYGLPEQATEINGQTEALLPVRLPGGPYRDLLLGEQVNIALDDRGSVWSWGGQKRPAIIPKTKDFIEAAVDTASYSPEPAAYFIAKRKDGSLWTWKENLDRWKKEAKQYYDSQNFTEIVQVRGIPVK